MFDIAIVGNAARSHIVKQFQAMRQSKRYANTRFVIFAESNGDWGRTDDYGIILKQNVPGVEIVSFDKSKEHRLGVTTTRPVKESGLVELQYLLENNTIHLSENLISDRPVADVTELLIQMGRFRRAVDIPLRPEFGPGRNNLSGKGAGGQQDDLCSGLQILLAQIKVYQDRTGGQYVPY
jgi:hypothetical protein